MQAAEPPPPTTCGGAPDGTPCTWTKAFHGTKLQPQQRAQAHVSGAATAALADAPAATDGTDLDSETVSAAGIAEHALGMKDVGACSAQCKGGECVLVSPSQHAAGGCCRAQVVAPDQGKKPHDLVCWHRSKAVTHRPHNHGTKEHWN